MPNNKKPLPKNSKQKQHPQVNFYNEFQTFLNEYMREHKKVIGAPPHFETVYIEPRFFETELFNELAKEFIGKQYVSTVKK